MGNRLNSGPLKISWLVVVSTVTGEKFRRGVVGVGSPAVVALQVTQDRLKCDECVNEETEREYMVGHVHLVHETFRRERKQQYDA